MYVCVCVHVWWWWGGGGGWTVALIELAGTGIYESEHKGVLHFFRPPPSHTQALSLTCSTQVAQVWVALPHGQEAGAVFSVAGATPTATPWEPVLTVGATVTELLAEAPWGYTSTGLVTWLSRVVTGTILVLEGGLTVQFGLDLTMVIRPRP